MSPTLPTIVITVSVLDNLSVDALTELLHKLSYNQVVVENVTRITASKPLIPFEDATHDISKSQ